MTITVCYFNANIVTYVSMCSNMQHMHAWAFWMAHLLQINNFFILLLSIICATSTSFLHLQCCLFFYYPIHLSIYIIILYAFYQMLWSHHIINSPQPETKIKRKIKNAPYNKSIKIFRCTMHYNMLQCYQVSALII